MMPSIDHALFKQPMTGLANECGDTGVIKTVDNVCFLGLIDVLGHGEEAHTVASLAEAYLLKHFQTDLMDLMLGLHDHLQGTRGAVAALCRLTLSTGVVQHVGIGNIMVKIYGSDSFSFVARDGVIGYSMIHPKAQSKTIYPGDLLLLSSDGIKQHFYPEQYPGLFDGTAAEIAKRLVKTLGKAADDASCIVLRLRR